MKILITGSEPDTRAPHVEIIMPGDDLSAEDALDAAKRALVAWGFHWNDIFESED